MRKNNDYSDNNHCTCGKLISNGAKNCNSCSRKGSKNGNFLDGRTAIKHCCIDCGKELKLYTAQRCEKCARIESNGYNFKDGRCLKKYYCSEPGCNNEINYRPAIYGKGKCKICSDKLTLFKIGRIPENYIDGRSYEPYTEEFTQKLKDFIRTRDNFECQNCGMTEEEHLIVNGQVLHVHHIDYNKQNCKEDNLITVCISCNSRANYNREYWKTFYKIKIYKKIRQGE